MTSLDREEANEYLLTIAALDGVHVSTTQVQIYVTDVNDGAPKFEMDAYYFDVSEDSVAGKLKITLEVHLQGCCYALVFAVFMLALACVLMKQVTNQA